MELPTDQFLILTEQAARAVLEAEGGDAAGLRLEQARTCFRVGWETAERHYQPYIPPARGRHLRVVK